MIILTAIALSYSLSCQITQTEHSIDDIHLRDPFVLPVPEENMYYLFGTGWTLPDGPGFMVYHSSDLKEWHGPSVAFQYRVGFWSDREYWAPEVHKYRDRYYMFASFKANGLSRGTQILVSNKPGGTYEPLTEKPITPEDWECLDGTLFIDDAGQPWMVFCHEWLQVGDGEISAIPLSDDLKQRTGDPILLFRASEAAWVVDMGGEKRGKVTDGPFFHRMANGSLVMLWSSFSKSGYCQAIAVSESGKLNGPWRHPEKPIREEDGGHGMLFRTFDGDLRLILHQPNHGAPAIPTIMKVAEQDNTLILSP